MKSSAQRLLDLVQNAHETPMVTSKASTPKIF